jgi:hypothetical protein
MKLMAGSIQVYTIANDLLHSLGIDMSELEIWLPTKRGVLLEAIIGRVCFLIQASNSLC